MKTLATLIAAVVLSGNLPGSMPGPKPGAAKTDEAALVQLEEKWLHARDLATLEGIYGGDFVHIRSNGQILTRDEDLAGYRRLQAPPAANLHRQFEFLKVRVYGTIGIVNGRTAAADENGKMVRETSFTDVFIRRGNRWEAINAQETPVER